MGAPACSFVIGCLCHLCCLCARRVAGGGRGSGRTGILFTPEADTPEFCYLLSSCSKRMIENVLCTIGENNFLDVKLFTPSLAACQQHCEDTTGCK